MFDISHRLTNKRSRTCDGPGIAVWRDRLHYGPWSAKEHGRIGPELAAVHAQRESIPSRYDNETDRYRLTDDALHSDLDTGGLLNFVCATRPMRRAAPGEPLMLFVTENAETPATIAVEVTPLNARQDTKHGDVRGEAQFNGRSLPPDIDGQPELKHSLEVVHVARNEYPDHSQQEKQMSKSTHWVQSDQSERTKQGR